MQHLLCYLLNWQGSIDVISTNSFLLAPLLRSVADLGVDCILNVLYVKLDKRIGEDTGNKLIFGTLQLLFTAGSLWGTYWVRRQREELLVVFLLAGLVLLLFLKKGFVSQFLDNKISAFLGSISYSFYLIHLIVLHFFYFLFTRVDYWQAVFFSILISTCFPVVFKLLIGRISRIRIAGEKS